MISPMATASDFMLKSKTKSRRRLSPWGVLVAELFVNIVSPGDIPLLGSNQRELFFESIDKSADRILDKREDVPAGSAGRRQLAVIFRSGLVIMVA